MLINLNGKYDYIGEPVSEALAARKLEMQKCAVSRRSDSTVVDIELKYSKTVKHGVRLTVALPLAVAVSPLAVDYLQHDILRLLDDASWGEKDGN